MGSFVEHSLNAGSYQGELLGHMPSAIRNLTRHPTNDPPKWTTINYEHPLTEEWNQGLGTR